MHKNHFMPTAFRSIWETLKALLQSDEAYYVKHREYIVNYLVNLAPSASFLLLFLFSDLNCSIQLHTYSSEEKWVHLSFSLGADINTVLSTCCLPPQAGPAVSEKGHLPWGFSSMLSKGNWWDLALRQELRYCHSYYSHWVQQSCKYSPVSQK